MTTSSGTEAQAAVGPAAPPPDSPTWGWAVAEIRKDGSWSATRLVPASAQPDASARTAGNTPRLPDVSSALCARIGSFHAAEGRLHLAAAAFGRGGRTPTTSIGREECLGRLAHVLALRGDLTRAGLVASSLPSSISSISSTDSARDHARTALVWAALLRGDLAHASHLLGAPELAEVRDDPWLATSRTVARSELLVATGDPDAATRFLAADAEVCHDVRRPSWLTDLLTVARAEALLAAGEVNRSLAVLTPLPVRAHAVASVVAATARLTIGDRRGAQSVLTRVAEELDREPLTVQMQAWLLNARLAEGRGEHERADIELDRVLRTATSTGVQLPLLHHCAWIRRQLDRSTELLHVHRAVLARCDLSAFPGRPVPGPWVETPSADGVPTAPLTEREVEVLELLAQMFSTEEIAGALFISVNTVKTHLKGIFGKLCVNRRVDAVRRGRQHGLC